MNTLIDIKDIDLKRFKFSVENEFLNIFYDTDKKASIFNYPIKVMGDDGIEECLSLLRDYLTELRK